MQEGQRGIGLGIFTSGPSAGGEARRGSPVSALASGGCRGWEV
jgi:hypothetical protein